MSTSDSIVSSQTKQSSWRKSDTTWTLGLFGTAIGAGVLFFPIRAGFGGLIPILLMLVLAYPIAFYCHRALARLCLSGSNPSGNITETVEEHFGKTGGVVITFRNSAVIDQVDLGSLSLTGHDGILITVWLGISIMVFSFNFSPIVSSFVVSKREEYEKDFGRDFTERKCSQIISRASMLMVAVVMFFAFSCLFTLSPANMAEAKAQNIPVLSYLANHFASMTGTKTTFAITLEYAASIIALVAIFKSFFGHYLGTLEGLNGLILKFGYKGDKTKVSLGKLNTISMIFIMGSTWVVAYANPNILDLIEAMGAPIIASLLCLLPMYAIRKAPSLAKYRGRLDNVFVTVIGLLTILNIVYKLF
ncbi:TPA: hypothetical protein IB910_001020 [Escherichia coli]|nr:hypothetical protein [Escherichia coli]